MKRFLIFTVFFLLLVPFSIGGEFWASKNSNKYHYPNCRWAQKIKPSNLIKFGSPEEATKAGYIPCKVCKPPTASKAELNINSQYYFVLLETETIEIILG